MRTGREEAFLCIEKAVFPDTNPFVYNRLGSKLSSPAVWPGNLLDGYLIEWVSLGLGF